MTMIGVALLVGFLVLDRYLHSVDFEWERYSPRCDCNRRLYSREAQKSGKCRECRLNPEP